MGQSSSTRRYRSRSRSRRRSPSGHREKAKAPTALGFSQWRARKRHRIKGLMTADKVPNIPKYPENKLKLLKLNRLKDWATMEEEFLLATGGIYNSQILGVSKKNMKLFEKLRGSPMIVGVLEDIVDENHAIVSVANGQLPFYVSILSIVDRDRLEPNARVLLSKHGFCIVGVIENDFSQVATKMRIEKAPTETFADIGGLEKQIQEIREVIELPLTQPELFEETGIQPQKGVILYGPPGTGKTMLARAVANSTSATFIRVAGSELVQKQMGAGPKLVREIFRIAEENAPSIVFIDEVDSVGGKRDGHSKSEGEKEVQRTMLELLNQLDGFESKKDVRIIMATNRIDCLDPALIRPGRIDRKIEIPLPSDHGRKCIFDLSTKGLNIEPSVDFETIVADEKEMLSGADIKAMCAAAGIVALRERSKVITSDHFQEAKRQVMYKKKNNNMSVGLYI